MTSQETSANSGVRALARNLHHILVVRTAILLCLSWLPNLAAAQDQVLLQEVMPEYADSELGDLPVADAPALGTTLVVRRSDVLRALKRAGASTAGIVVPVASRVSRKLVRLSAEVVLAAAEHALEEAAQPCTIVRAKIQDEVSVSDGPRSVRAELGRTVRSGAVGGAIIVQSAGREIRVPLTATLSCPEPDVSTGKQITIFAVFGNVTVSAPGEAKQNGRVGEVIRVQNRATGTALQARIVDQQSAEVVQ